MQTTTEPTDKLRKFYGYPTVLLMGNGRRITVG